MDKLISCYRLSKMESKAIRFLNKFLEKYPYNQNAWFEIGNLYFERKMIKESIASHEFSIICNETFSPSYVELGKICEYKLDFNKAIYYYEILKSLDSVTSFSLYRLSVCYEKIGAYDKAINHLNEIISKDPLYEKAWISIAKHYLRKNDHDKALENLNKALNIIANNY
jgi:tetratricopeptide (TPR) repeat protein